VIGPEQPQRLRLAAAPGSPLGAGLAAARHREPSDAQLRALQASLAIALGAAATGAAVTAGVGATAHIATAGTTIAATATLKVTAALVALATMTGGVAVYRYAHLAAPAPVRAVATRAERPAPRVPVAAAAPAEMAMPAAAPLPASAERLASLPRRATVDSNAQRIPSTVSKGAGPDELALIVRAQRTLASDPAAALALIEENRRPLAQSAFGQEAEVIAVTALTRLGRTAEAREQARRFVARFPDSVHAPRMRRVAAIIN
jgi:hypothetical protein